MDLLRLLAFQIGQEVSVAELATNLALNRQTVERYLDLLEKVFVIFKGRGLSRNLRKEITKTSRYYFFDNGVRNSLIQNFNRLALRNDLGQLWENYLMVERCKANQYAGRGANTYFWRTYDQKEIDCVEEREGRLFGYEFKWQGQVRGGDPAGVHGRLPRRRGHDHHARELHRLPMLKASEPCCTQPCVTPSSPWPAATTSKRATRSRMSGWPFASSMRPHG